MFKFCAAPALIAGLALLSSPPASSAGVSFSISIAPPELRVYQQPPCPTDGYLWTPGYWAYNGSGYYWVAGAWVAPPQPGLLWTPGYWGFEGGHYGFNAGYWGETVGFYGGVNYGFGYGGHGYEGGRWEGGHFRYNTTITNVNRTVIHNTYQQRITINNDHTSFNGGPHGIAARPTGEESTARTRAAALPVNRNRPAEQRQQAPHQQAQAQQHPVAAKPEQHAAVAKAEQRPAAAKPEQRPAPVKAEQRPEQHAEARPQQARPEAHAAPPQRQQARPQPARAEAKPAERKEEKK